MIAAGLAIGANTVFRTGGFDSLVMSAFAAFGALRMVLAAIGTWRDDESGAEHALDVLWFGCWFSATVASVLLISRVVSPFLDGEEVGGAGVAAAMLAGLSVVCFCLCRLVPDPEARDDSGAAPEYEPRPAPAPLIDVPDGRTPSATVLGLAESRRFGAFRTVAESDAEVPDRRWAVLIGLLCPALGAWDLVDRAAAAGVSIGHAPPSAWLSFAGSVATGLAVVTFLVVVTRNSRRAGRKTIFQFERGSVVRDHDGRLEAGPVSVGSVRDVVEAVDSGRRVRFGEIVIDGDGITGHSWGAPWTEVVRLEARGSRVVVELVARTERAGSTARPISDAPVLTEAAEVLVRRARTMR